MREIKNFPDLLKLIGSSTQPVLISGKSGTGKTWFGTKLKSMGINAFNLDHIGFEPAGGQWTYDVTKLENLLEEGKMKVYVGVASGMTLAMRKNFTIVPIVPDTSFHRATVAVKFIDSVMERIATREYRTHWYDFAFNYSAKELQDETFRSFKRNFDGLYNSVILQKSFISGLPLRGWHEHEFPVNSNHLDRVLAQGQNADGYGFLLFNLGSEENKQFYSEVVMTKDGYLIFKYGHGFDVDLEVVKREFYSKYEPRKTETMLTRTLELVIPRFTAYISKKHLNLLKPTKQT